MPEPACRHCRYSESTWLLTCAEEGAASRLVCAHPNGLMRDTSAPCGDYEREPGADDDRE